MENNNIVKVEIEVTGCINCPYCKKSRAYAGPYIREIWVCEKGAYGEELGEYNPHPSDSSYSYIDPPARFHPKCPINKNKDPKDALSFLIYEICNESICPSKLASKLDKYNLDVIFKKGDDSNEK